MTTSILSHLSAELHPNDLQTLKDFALDAPWEWQQALRALVEIAEQAQDHEDAKDEAEGELANLREKAKDVIKEIKAEMETFYTTGFAAQDRIDFASAVNKSLDTLDKGSDEP